MKLLAVSLVSTLLLLMPAAAEIATGCNPPSSLLATGSPTQPQTTPKTDSSTSVGLVVTPAAVTTESAQTSPATVPGSGLLHLPPTTDPGAQKAGQLLEQMVATMGGAAYLNVQDMEQEGRTYRFYHGEPEGTGALFWRFWRWPDKDRVELTKQRDWIVLFVGDQGYDITFRGTATVEKDQLDDYLRRRNHSLLWVLRRWLDQPGVALFYEGMGIAERKQADQISIITSANDAVTISIDSTTHLPLRIGFTWRDLKTHDRNDDAEGYDNYRPIQGIMTPFSITRYHNGEPATQRFITLTRYNQNPPDSMFTATLTAPGNKPRK
jgi:hypothetical protein